MAVAAMLPVQEEKQQRCKVSIEPLTLHVANRNMFYELLLL